MPKSNPDPQEQMPDFFKGYIPVGVEYQDVSDVPWNDVMSKIETSTIDGLVGFWTSGDLVSQTKTRYMSHWFDGATNMLSVAAPEDNFFNVQGECYVSGDHIFDGCDNLLGGNGSSIETLGQTGTAGLHEDYYNYTGSGESTVYTPHYGLLTAGYNMINITYDYDYDVEDAPALDRQYVSQYKAFTIGGVGNNCAPIPTREGYAFKGWKHADKTYQPGTNLVTDDFVEDPDETIEFVAVWEELVQVDVPTWKENILYDATEHNVDNVEL